MDKNTIRVFGLASQLGFALAGPLVIFIGAGVLLDRHFHTTPLLILIGAVVGFILSGVALFDIVRQLPTSPSRRRTSLDEPSDPKV